MLSLSSLSQSACPHLFSFFLSRSCPLPVSFSKLLFSLIFSSSTISFVRCTVQRWMQHCDQRTSVCSPWCITPQGCLYKQMPVDMSQRLYWWASGGQCCQALSVWCQNKIRLYKCSLSCALGTSSLFWGYSCNIKALGKPYYKFQYLNQWVPIEKDDIMGWWKSVTCWRRRRGKVPDLFNKKLLHLFQTLQSTSQVVLQGSS